MRVSLLLTVVMIASYFCIVGSVTHKIVYADEIRIKDVIASKFNNEWAVSNDGKIAHRLIPQYDVYSLLEMMAAFIEIKNISQEPLVIGPRNPIDDFHYEIVGPNGILDTKDYTRGNIPDIGAAKYTRMSPGQVIRILKYMVYKGATTEGKYQIKNTYEVHIKQLEDAAKYGINNLWIGSITSKQEDFKVFPKDLDIQRTKNISYGESWEPVTMCSYCESGHNLRWRLTLQENVCNIDSIWVESQLMNVSDRAITFDLKENGEKPLLVLIPHGKESIIRPLVKRPGLEYEIYNRKPSTAGGTSVAHAFRADLRDYFGQLDPGWYQFCVVWPAKGYDISDLPQFTTVDLISPMLSFQVTTTTVADSNKLYAPLKSQFNTEWYTQSLTPINMQIVRDNPFKINSDKAVATIKNNFTANDFGERIIYIPYYPRKEGNGKIADEKTYFAKLIGMRWNPIYGWAPMSGWEDRNKPPQGNADSPLEYPLEPGKTMKIALPDSCFDGDGIYCYYMNIHLGKIEHSPSSPFIFVSDAFVIDRYKNPQNGASSSEKPSDKPAQKDK
jgi:hypothetical protein